MAICTLSMQRTWWPVASTTLVTGYYWRAQPVKCGLHTARRWHMIRSTFGCWIIIKHDIQYSTLMTSELITSPMTLAEKIMTRDQIFHDIYWSFNPIKIIRITYMTKVAFDVMYTIIFSNKDHLNKSQALVTKALHLISHKFWQYLISYGLTSWKKCLIS